MINRKPLLLVLFALCVGTFAVLRAADTKLDDTTVRQNVSGKQKTAAPKRSKSAARNKQADKNRATDLGEEKIGCRDCAELRRQLNKAKASKNTCNNCVNLRNELDAERELRDELQNELDAERKSRDELQNKLDETKKEARASKNTILIIGGIILLLLIVVAAIIFWLVNKKNNAAKDQMKSNLDSTKKKYREEITALKRQSADEKWRYENELGRKNQELSQRDTDLARARAKIKQLELMSSDAQAYVSQEFDRKKQEFDRQKAAEIASLTSGFDIEKNNLLQQVTDKDSEITRVNSQYKQTCENYECQLNTLKLEHSKAIEAANERHRCEIEKCNNDLSAEKASHDADVAKWEEKLQTEKDRRAVELDALTKQCNENMRAERERCNTALEVEKRERENLLSAAVIEFFDGKTPEKDDERIIFLTLSQLAARRVYWEKIGQIYHLVDDIKMLDVQLNSLYEEKQPELIQWREKLELLANEKLLHPHYSIHWAKSGDNVGENLSHYTIKGEGTIIKAVESAVILMNNTVIAKSVVVCE